MELNRSEKAVIKRVLKGCEKNHRPEYNGAVPIRLPYYSENQLYAFTDMQRVVVSDDPGDFPLLDESLGVIIVSLFDDFRKCRQVPIDVDPEKVKENKARRKEEKSGVPYIINTDKGKIYLKHDFLLDAMKFCECNGIYIKDDARYVNGNYLSTVYLDDEHLRRPCSRLAIILPVNCNTGA